MADSPQEPALEEKEMSFLDHLEELRWHIIRSLGAIVVFALTAFLNKKFIFHDVILGPARVDFITYRAFCKLGQLLVDQGLSTENALCIDKLSFVIQSRTMTGQFATHIGVSFLAGLIVAFPYVFWEIWRFVAPGLYPKERALTRGAVFYVSFLFLSGVLFGYYVLSPLSINFLANYVVDDSITNQFDLSSYMNTLVMMVLSCGIMFQLPMVVYVLAKIGIMTPTFMRTYRRHAIVVIMLIAAIITPGGDVFSLMLVAIPIYFLYEISIFIARAVERNKAEQARLEAQNR